MLNSFLIASVIGVVLILLCLIVFYEIMAHVWVNLPRLEGRPRLQILFTVTAAFFAHTICVWIFGLSYYYLDTRFEYGSLQGDITKDIFDYVYFSCVSYSALGLGDVIPTGGLQLLVGVEAILGLILIGWTVAFTYVVAEKYFFHRRKPPPED